MSKIMFVSSLDHMSGGDAWHCLLQIVIQSFHVMGQVQIYRDRGCYFCSSFQETVLVPVLSF